MLENSRKRARKSKLEVREGVELEEATILYMETHVTNVKEEPTLDLVPALVGAQYQEPLIDAVPVADHKPIMEFSVKIEVEEFDETDTKESMFDMNNGEDESVKKIEPKLNSSNSLSKDSASSPSIKAIERTKSTKPQKNVKTKEFKEYITNRFMILEIIERICKSINLADKCLIVEVRNYMGRILDEPIMSFKDTLICRALDEWQEWHLEHSAVRDVPLVYKCYICGKSWWHLYGFRDHIDEHTSLEQLEVSLESNNDECSLICFQLDIVYSDVELPESNCDRCGKPANSHAFVYDDPYTCSGCQMTFSTCSQLYLHESTCAQYKESVFQNVTGVLKCTVCSLECNTEHLNEHMIRKHSVRSDNVVPWELRKCNICGRSYIFMDLHICVRRAYNYGCNHCGKSFQKKLYKEIHMENYSKPSQCIICHKILSAKCMEPSHMLQHTDKFALMYKCIQCIEGMYYPDEASIVHHTKTVHYRPFEKKFKYLEMVILPKKSLNRSPASILQAYSEQSKKKVVPKSKIFAPSLKYTKKTMEPPKDVVVKQEPSPAVDIDTLVVADLSTLKTEAVDELAPHIKISDITSLQDLIKLKTEPVEEVADDLIIVEEKSETITLYTSDDSIDEVQLKYPGCKRKQITKWACFCGYIDVKSKITAHKVTCPVAKAKRARELGHSTSDSKCTTDKHESSDGSSDDCNDEYLQDDLENSDEDWSQEIPKRSKIGYKYTCHCKKVIEGSLAGFRRHKKTCEVVALLRRQNMEAKKSSVYKCTKCSTSFSTMQKYAKHFNRTHYFHNFMCPQCLGTFDGLSKLTSHITSHVNKNFLKMRVINESQEWMKCTECKVCRSPVEKEDYFKHWESHLVLHPGENLEARDSDNAFEESLEIDTEPAEVGSVYTQDLMQRALAWLQSPDGLGNVDEKTCVFCERRFSRKNDSKRHVIEHLLQDAYAQRIHHKTLRCQICAQGFPKDDRFKHHMREHASLPVYQCNLCGKSFSDSSNFCKHRKVHGLSLMCCSVCDKKFHNHNHLARHMEMHDKTKPIICDTCGKVSYTQSAHKRHVRCAHERHRTQLHCPICRAVFTRFKDKWDHMWHIHKERKFDADCPICSQAFRRFTDVKAHVKEIHNRQLRLSVDRRLEVFV